MLIIAETMYIFDNVPAGSRGALLEEKFIISKGMYNVHAMTAAARDTFNQSNTFSLD